MALMQTPQYTHDFHLPEFTLKNIDGNMVSTEEIKGENGTIIAFICNHCPYVKAIIDRLAADFKLLQSEEFGCVAIMPNDTENYPADSFGNMKIFAAEHGFTFPYLLDETQEIAKKFDAVCTPDIYGFDRKGVLRYRGRLDSAGPNSATPTTTKELVNAMRLISRAGQAPAQQNSSMGCSIKWK